MMNAIVYDKRNKPDRLALRKVEKPLPGEKEVLVKIHAVSVNAADYRSLKMGIIPKRKIFGADIAGWVEAVGEHTQLIRVGDKVLGDLSGIGFGGFAEYVTAPEKVLTLKPAQVSFVDAAALPMAAVTALQGLRMMGNIQSGQKVLIHGAGGGVGTFAVQLARHFGAEVTAVCSTRNIELVSSLGADQVIDYTKEDFLKTGKRYDLIAVINGKRSILDYRRALTDSGVCVLVGGALSQLLAITIFGGLLSIGSRKFRILAAKPNPEDLALITDLVADGKIRPVIDKVFPFEETAKAVRYLSDGNAQGKVVILVAEENLRIIPPSPTATRS
ncbi:MAG: NAD(P)-dependent alcohol dehydrogenase [Anaerolineaceae bacterium]|jgi:NADPH:quinone reductase-like Zn-dependent oxidoreductase